MQHPSILNFNYLLTDFLILNILTYLLTYLLTCLLTCLVACLLIYLLSWLLTCLLTNLLTYSLVCLLTYLLTFNLSLFYGLEPDDLLIVYTMLIMEYIMKTYLPITIMIHYMNVNLLFHCLVAIFYCRVWILS